MEVFNEFSKKYNKSNVAQKETQSDIEKLESEFNIFLPKDYKLFLQEVGNITTPDIFDLIYENEFDLHCIERFWDIGTIIYDKKYELTSQLSVDLVPIAEGVGSVFGFLTADLKIKKESAPVYIFELDFINTAEKVSESFTEWIGKFNNI